MVYVQKTLSQQYYLSTPPRAVIPIHRENIEQILLANGLPEETVAAIMMLYKSTKVIVHSPDGDTYYIVVGGLQRDTLAPYLFIILPRLWA